MGNNVTTGLESGAHESIDDNELVLNISAMLEDLDTSILSQCCIYRVPGIVRRLNQAAYTPQVVSIGPYHHGEDRLMPMEGFKRRYCKELIGRGTRSLNDYIHNLKRHEERARRCYEGNFNGLSSEDFLAMLLVDGCFIIEFLHRSIYSTLRGPDDDIPSMQLLWINIKHDLVLLENQLPFFILESLYDVFHHTYLYPWESSNLHNLVLSLFEAYNKNDEFPDFSSVNHFTDLIRLLHKPKEQTWNPNHRGTGFIASATQLHEAGVKFKMVPGKCLLDINFENQCLELPCFELNDDKESLYRNLMALELCHYPNETFITDYFVFMDTLIDTSYDINLLVQSGVLLNRSGDYHGAARSFNNFCAGITHYHATSYLIPLYGKLNAHLKKPTHTWMASLKRDYFSTPFKIASTIAAVSLLLLTLISAVCSIISIL